MERMLPCSTGSLYSICVLHGNTRKHLPCVTMQYTKEGASQFDSQDVTEDLARDYKTFFMLN